MTRILSIIGTRPEGIKMAPVIRELSRHPDAFESIVAVTGQHDQLLRQVLDLFSIRPDFDLAAMKPNQDLCDLAARILSGIRGVLQESEPDFILVQGDTATVFAASIAAFYRRVRIGHVEAGLRTSDKSEPFPEEMHRLLTDQMSDLLFAPTEGNRRNLLAEGLPDEKIHVTGNTIVDALLEISAPAMLPPISELSDLEEPFVLITAHRRENFGAPFQKIFHAIRRLAELHPHVQFVYPVHPNPNVRSAAFQTLSGRKNIRLIQPLDYLSFLHLMKKCRIIMSDSGGVQEEAPSFHKPLLVLRDKTERSELIEAGGAKLVGCNQELIIREASRLLREDEYYRRMSDIRNPFGDGTASRKIVKILLEAMPEERKWKTRNCIAS
ncbi:MAG: UDP-N-acetylglucosamine 2-epimerase (non-hydrolyzing) [Desulfobacteraceae bacterium]|nr:MAG: UDP-N-acetylglucosamine 2-epimerase (non-hydrolyzing) [Desulfobacteraceae bacterium]